MNGDGVVDIGDALVVAQFDVQCDVRLIGCAFICGPFACPSTTSRRCWASPPTTCSTWHAGSITGSEQLVIPLRSPEAVSRCQPVLSLLKRYGRVNDDRFLAYVFAEAGEGEIRARFFFPKGTAIAEDPATGSACANLGGWFLAEDAALPLNRVIRQGDEVGRPSRLVLRVDGERRIFVSGQVIELGRGVIAL